MSDIDDQDGTSQEPEGSETTSAASGTSQPDELSLARRRQAGAEAARQAAEAKAREYEQELAKYREAAQTAEQKDLSELARLQANLEAAERRAAEAEAKAEARILDARFPNARKELPEVTDEVRLAKFEAMMAEEADPVGNAPTPLSHNESRTSTPRKQAAEETAADVKARLLSMPVPPGWGS